MRDKIEYLIGSLESADEKILNDAALSLIGIGVSVVEPLIQALRTKEEECFRLIIAHIIEKIGNSAVKDVVLLLKDKDPNVRTWATYILKNIKDIRATEPLIEVFKKDEEERVRWGVLVALGEIGTIDFNLLIQATKDSYWNVRVTAARFLEKSKDPRAVEPLIELLKDKDHYVRGEVLSVWYYSEWLKHNLVVGIVINLLKEESSITREHAAGLLGKATDPKATEPLINLLKDSDWQVREKAIWALRMIKDERAVEPLIIALKDEIKEVKKEAVRALDEFGDSRAITPLKKCFIEEENIFIRNSIEDTLFRLERKEGAKYTVSQKYVHKAYSSAFSFDNDSDREVIIKIIKENPGIIQKDLYKKGYDSYMFWQLEKSGYIRREKCDNSWKLFYVDNISKVKSRRFLERKYEDRVNIPTESYPDSRERIIKYFGEETIETLLKYAGEIGTPLFEIGACLEFDMNESLIKVINKYWIKDCDEALKKFYSKYGFFSDRNFIDYELEKILGRDSLLDFYAELEAEAHTFKIKWCGARWTFIQSPHIPWDYVQHLRFKWGLKPEIHIKECVCCGDSFYPFYYASRFYPYCDYFRQIITCFPIEDSIKEVNFCPKHFPTSSYGTFLADEIKNDPTIKETMKDLLKKLIDILEFIPPKSFHKSLYYLKGLPKEKFDDAIRIISSMPPFEKELSTQPEGYKDIFGSWLQVLDAAGILEGGVRKTSRGYICLAKDGHECRSIGEKIIDDYLFAHNISHEQEPHYPGERQFRADWKVGQYFIEFWGLKGDEDYDIKMEEKRVIAQLHQIPLIEITFDDLRNLGQKFKDIIFK